MDRWLIETSHMVSIPDGYTARDIADLKAQVQATADGKKVNSKRPPIGPLAFKVAENGSLLWAHFRDKHGRRARFMRLRRQH